ncbi:hypothetical protein [Segnochrobactrum spirostomi]|nr:hypothetical protein [Segnochrobactrum spirostomi]
MDTERDVESLDDTALAEANGGVVCYPFYQATLPTDWPPPPFDPHYEV